MFDNREVRFVVAIDIGTEYTSFAHSLKFSFSQSTMTFEDWEGQQQGIIKSPAIVEYNDDYSKIIKWGTPVLQQLKNASDPAEDTEFPREICTFQVFNNDNEEIWLPPELSKKKLISDYLNEIQKVIIPYLQENWAGIKPSHETGIIFIVPDRWGPTNWNILSQCLLENGSLCDNKENIQFISRGKAIAINCLTKNREILSPEDYFMIVEIDKDTINLTTREYTSKNVFSEILDRKGDYQENSSIEKRFLISQGIHSDIFDRKTTNLKQIYQAQLQMQPKVQSLIEKYLSSGKAQAVDIDSIIPSLRDIVLSLTDEELKKKLENKKNCIELDLKIIKELFDPLVNRLYNVIDKKLKTEAEYSGKEYSAIFYVGDIFKCNHLVNEIEKMKFGDGDVKTCFIPNSKDSVILDGALEYAQDDVLYNVLTSLLRR